MKLVDGTLRLAATDLSNHLGCGHLTMLNREVAFGRLDKPRGGGAGLDVLAERGQAHEAEYVEHLRSQGLTVEDLSNVRDADATQRAMRAGADVIVQATLHHDGWHGEADILRRVETPSDLGAWSYEVQDAKLARNTRAGTILQLCLYSDLLHRAQGRQPELMHVIAPGRGFAPESYRVDAFLAAYRWVRRRLEEATLDPEATELGYPEPVAQCDICRWWKRCDARWREDDHLSLIAGASTSQRKEFVEHDIVTLGALGQRPTSPITRPERGSKESYERVWRQAQIQLRGREEERPVHELLDREAGRGLARLPEPSPGDVFFDIEGDRFVGTGGLEYLLGWAVLDDDGRPTYQCLWALNAEEEKRAFEDFVDMVMARRAEHPGMHVYHYAHYEPTAMKRLMGRYATREAEIDELLRSGTFVDLYAVVTQSLRASVESYSIKKLEPFYAFARTAELEDASHELRVFERALELGQVESISAASRETVRAYNEDDCFSTVGLRNWLESLRAELVAAGETIPRPEPADGEASEGVREAAEQVEELRKQLIGDVSADPAQRSKADQARWLLAHMLDWHRREQKVTWWEYFRLCDLAPEALLDEKDGIGGLEFDAVVDPGNRRRCPVHRYTFPIQDTLIDRHASLFQPGGEKIGTLVEIDLAKRTVDIKRTRATAETHPPAVFAHDTVSHDPLEAALFRLGEHVAKHGVTTDGPHHRCEVDLLLGRRPRLASSPAATDPLRADDEDSLAAARRLALDLDGGVLAIQGPPGSGKTYTAARMIVSLAKAGKRVGVTAMSHKVIRNLLEAVVKAARDEGEDVRCIRKPSSRTPPHPDIGAKRSAAEIHAALDQDEAHVAGGTAWLWASEDLTDAVDVLFVDEAGQMSLVDTLAAAQAAKSLVLLGDPQQLDHPIQGTHPEGTDVSALQHLLGDDATIAPHRGLFLEETRRLHENICAFTSELFYERRLRAHASTQQHVLQGDTPFAGAGLWAVPVEHEGNQSRSHEEVAAVANVFDHLLRSRCRWTDREGQTRNLGPQDILIVAPYNAQVGALQEALPNARIGTVDKFQGQEAPVVIYSMTTSSKEEAPRGMEFLFSLNRLNVATSRACCVSILVANPRLFEADCRTPRELQLANAFCRYLEMATVVVDGVVGAHISGQND